MAAHNPAVTRSTRRVPAAVPQRLLHRRRPVTATGRRVASLGGDAAERRRHARSTRPSGTATTASARAADPRRCAGRRPRPQTGAAPITDIGAVARPGAPIVLLDADDRRAPAVSGPSSTPTRPTPRTTDADHPTRRVNLAEGHRYIVALRILRDGAASTISRAGLPPLPRRRSRRPARRSSSAGATLRGASSRRSAGRASAATISTWPGTSPSRASATSPSGCCTSATTRSASSATRSSPTGRSRDARRSSPSTGQRLHALRYRRLPARRERRDRRATSRARRGALLSRPGRLPAGRVPLRRTGLPIRQPGNSGPRTSSATSRARQPRRRHGRRALALRPRPARRARARSTPATSDHGNEHDFMFCATDWIGLAERRRHQRGRVLRTSPSSPPPPTGCSRACSTSCTSAALMIHPTGFAATRAFQVAETAAVLDTARTLYYDGNSQGGIIGGALTAVAPGLHPRRCSACPAWTTRLCSTAASTSSRSRRSSTTATPTSSTSRSVFGLMQMLWDRARPTATPTT